jgi:metallo-beta-lactamase family protein
MHVKLTFLGATRCVTGSRHLVEANGLKFLIDCGLYQERDLLGRNWERFPVPPSEIDAVLLTHAHIDHCGFLPRFYREGFEGRIYCTGATVDITKIMLLDAARLQEQDAEHKRRRHEKEGRKGPHPEVPLYTAADAESCFPLFSPVPYGRETEIGEGISFTLHDAGHVLGSGMIAVKVREGNEERKLLFSGDIGRTGRPFLHDPALFDQADYVVTESTYADRVLPDPKDLLPQFTDVVKSTVAAGGNVLIPSFALERSQDVLYYLNRAQQAGMLPVVPVYLDSPMAVNITDVFTKHVDLFDNETRAMMKQGKSPFDLPGLHMVADADESCRLVDLREPAIILAGSGMCTGGRVKYHLVSNITRKESTILFVGYQAVGTLGRLIVDGAKEVRILGQNYPVRARVVQLAGFSSHADGVQLQRWLFHLKRAPRQVFVVHGEEASAMHYANTVRVDKGWNAVAPEYLQAFDLE